MKFVVRGGMFDQRVHIYTESEEEFAELTARYPNWSREDNGYEAFFLQPTMQAFRDYCEGIVAEAPDKVNDDGGEGAFVAEVLRYFAEAQKCIENGDAEAAAEYAFYAGWKFEQMRLKFNFEAVAETGAKTHKYLNNLRTARNKAAKVNVDQRRAAVAKLMKETELNGGALDAWLRRQLKDKCGIKVSERTIRGDRKALRS